MNKRKYSLMSKGVAVAATAILLTSVLTSTSAAADSLTIKPVTSYVGNNYTPSARTPVIKPLWSIMTDIPDNDYKISQGVIAAGGGRAYYLQKGKLQAIDVKTGKLVWSYGTGLSLPLLYDSGRVYVGSVSGTLSAVNAVTGKKLWTSAATYKNMDQFFVNENQLFVVNGDILSFNAMDGKLQWKDNYEWPVRGPIAVSENRIVVRNQESGAYTFSNLFGFDSKTGKNIWKLPYYRFPVQIKAGTVLVQREITLFDQTMLPTLDSIDLQTGKLLKTTVFNPEKMDLARPDLFRYGFISITGEGIYIDMGEKVYGYPADLTKLDNNKRDTYTPNKTGARFAAGPYDGRFLFTDGLGIYGVKTVNKSSIDYVEGISNPVARFDLIGHGIYEAQTDGKFVAIDLVTAKPLLELQTYGRVFGPTIAESGIILIQSKGKLLGIKEPQALVAK